MWRAVELQCCSRMISQLWKCWKSLLFVVIMFFKTGNWKILWLFHSLSNMLLLSLLIFKFILSYILPPNTPMVSIYIIFHFLFIRLCPSFQRVYLFLSCLESLRWAFLFHQPHVFIAYVFLIEILLLLLGPSKSML